MHRKSRFLISLVIAAITFGTLWLSLGADHFNRGHKFCILTSTHERSIPIRWLLYNRL